MPIFGFAVRFCAGNVREIARGMSLPRDVT